MSKEILGSLELNRIYQFDCVAGMKLLPDGCIDLTVTSPPYDNLRKYNGFEFDYESTAKELFRITKNGGVVVWVIGDSTIKGSESGSSFKQALLFKELGFNIHDTMIYMKNSYVPLTHNRYEQQFEYMFVLSKGKPKTFNSIKIASLTAGTKRNRGKYKEDGQSMRGREETTIVSDTKIKGNVWTYDVGKNDKTFHPAVFPEQLVEDHILSWSEEEEVVLDPFMGSGTTAKMSLKTNRKFIGFEVSPEYIEIANIRIESINELL